MDPFEVRMQFIQLLKRLNASQQSIQKIVTYALKYFSRCGEDLWGCLVEECQNGSINTRINILYLLDSLCEASQLSRAAYSNNSQSGLYVDFVSKDLGTLVEYVVPEGREGLPNLTSTIQILENWRNKRIIDPHIIDAIIVKLNNRKAAPSDQSAEAASVMNSSSTFSRGEIFKRIEEDRERHKRLRERRWVQPISHNPQAHLLSQLATFMPDTAEGGHESELTIDIEFDNEWETTSDWNEDDHDAAVEECDLCFPSLQNLRRHPRHGETSL